ncbi:MAG: hypothetical protein JXB15_08665 [Anaerolineales bacterium]|nr:hypothetical protein [Anaerolineales bacterium]
MTKEQEWITSFSVTLNDVNRLVEWLNERKGGASIDDITRRIIRGRLLYGRDIGPSVIPAWEHKKHFLSWDEIDQWCEGCQVLVARWIEDQIEPFFGIVVGMDNQFYSININNDIIEYGRVQPGSSEANHYARILENISKREAMQNDQPELVPLDDQIDLVILKSGADIASQLTSTLQAEEQTFILWNQRWYLKDWVLDISLEKLSEIHRQIYRRAKTLTLPELRTYFPDLPEGDIGDLSLSLALAKAPHLFEYSVDTWKVIPPPPPPWNKAIGAYYVYDPTTFEIILKPGERLKKKAADRLKELGFYADVVVEAES